jgi:predicted metalloendopeptidase
MQKQYSKYKVQDKYPISGKLTLGENIADNGGTKLSYEAYLDWLKLNGPEPKLPDLPYDNTKLFFIGYAQEYCANVRPKTEYIATLSEIHSPSKFRVIGTLSNFEKFSEAFECSNTAKMNPKLKCEVW